MFEFSKELRERTAIFSLIGALKLEETAVLRKVFWECLHNENVDKLVVDLQKVPSFDWSVISLFVATKNVVSKRRGELILVGIKRNNYRLLEQTNLHHYFDIRPSTEEAMLDEPPPRLPNHRSQTRP